MKKILLILVILGICSALMAQTLYKNSFALTDETENFSGQLYGNGIVDLLVQDSIVWAATGYGLSKAMYRGWDNPLEWRSFSDNEYLGKGGVSAMAIMNDDSSTLWIATAFDTTAQGTDLPAGGGLSYTKDGGETWIHIPQPVDTKDVTAYAPTTTVIQNLTYDIAFVGETIWIASFGGGLRRSDDWGATWQVVTTDGLPFNSGQYLNHRAFSLLTVEDTLWVGTAEGISKTVDNGATWEHFTADVNDPATISGNFIVALAWQEETNSLWAATLPAESQGEVRAISRTSDGGATWERMLTDEQIFAHNIAFAENRVYVPSDQGLFYSNNNGLDWEEPLTALQDTDSGNEIFQEEYYSAAVQSVSGTEILWLGNSDGLAYTVVDDNLNNAPWNIARSSVSVKSRTKPKVYAYHSPFSPSRHYYVRFEFDEDKEFEGSIKIYDFAMDFVADIPTGELNPKWNGKNSAGKTVASGVYFFKAEIGGSATWGKVVVIN